MEKKDTEHPGKHDIDLEYLVRGVGNLNARVEFLEKEVERLRKLTS